MKKTVIITGSTDGIGRALALQLSGDYNLALCGRSGEKMEQLKRELGESSVYAECFNITDAEQRARFCRNVVREFGAIDVLVNSAGANTKKDRIADIDLEDLRYMFELNCVSALGMIQEVYPVMAAKRQGLIVNILSSCCLFSNPATGSYTASKDAMEGISKILTKEARADNIGVCSVYPGGVDTNFRAAAKPEYLRPGTIAKMIRNCIEVGDGCVHDIVIRPFVEENMP